MSSIIPLEDRIIVKKNQIPTKSIGGIIIPDTAENKPHDGVVVAVGVGKWENGSRIPLSVKIGDTVLFGKNAGTEYENNGDTVFIMYEKEIVAIVK